MARRFTDSGYDHRALPLGAAAELFLNNRGPLGGRIGRPRDSDLYHLLRGRCCSAPADGNSFHWAYATGLSLDRRRSGTRYGDPRAARDEMAGLLPTAGAGREIEGSRMRHLAGVL